MKRILFVALASLLLVNCGKDSYKIKGEIPGLEDGTMVRLSALDYDGLIDLDSTTVKDCKFTFKGKTDTAQVAVITFDFGESMRGCQLADELEDKIRMTLAADGDASEFYAQMGDLQERFTSVLAQSIEENANKLYGYQQLIENYSMFEPEVLMGLIEKLAPTFGQDMALLQLTSMTQAQLATSLGHPYIDFEAPILDKKDGYEGTAKLSDYVGKNKVVLLDFWASWCTPCLNEIPNLKAAYKKFHSKGFEIVSLSVDDGTEEWIRAVKNNGMNWVQMWNGEDMQNSAAVKYSVTAIPSTFLIDSEGTIIARNLRDKELEQALEDYFK